MKREQTAMALARLGAAYRAPIEDDQLNVWHHALDRFTPSAVERAVTAWIETEERFPTPAGLSRVAQQAQLHDTTQAAERFEGVPSVCAFCDGTGWQWVDTVSGAEAVLRCPCQPEPKPASEHAPKCKCADCADPISARRMRKWQGVGPDPLRVASGAVPRDTTGERF